MTTSKRLRAAKTYSDRKNDRIRAVIDAAIAYVCHIGEIEDRPEDEALAEATERLTCKVHPRAKAEYLDGFTREECSVVIAAWHLNHAADGEQAFRDLDVAVYELLAATARAARIEYETRKRATAG